MRPLPTGGWKVVAAGTRPGGEGEGECGKRENCHPKKSKPGWTRSARKSGEFGGEFGRHNTVSRSNRRPMVFGHTPPEEYIAVVYEELDRDRLSDYCVPRRGMIVTTKR